VVNEQAGSVLGPLDTYGVTQAMLDEQEAANAAFLAGIPLPRQGTILRKNATTSLKAEFKIANDLLRNELDPVVAILKTSQVDVFNTYTFARIIIDRRGKRKKFLMIAGKVLEKENGIPASGVTIWVVGTTLVVITGLDGIFRIPVKKEGKYILRSSRAGRKVCLTEVEITGEKMEDLVVEMGREE
jgi:hypothetical protein